MKERKGYRPFRPKYKARDGTLRETAAHWVELRDQREKVRRFKGFPSKKATEELGRNLVALVAYFNATGGQTDPALSAWLSAAPQQTRDQLVRIGLLPRERAGAGKPLGEHLTDWHTALVNKGTSREQTELSKGRAERLLTACKAGHLSDITPDRMLQALADLRAGSEGKRAVSQRTSNFYLAAVGQFLRWAVRDRRVSENPLAGLDKLTVTDARKRRALSVDEQRWLVTATADGGDWRGISGHERALIYRTALGSGFRASELAALTRASFDLDAATITLPLAATKNRKGAVQPITRELADALRPFLSTKAPAAPAFTMPSSYDTADMLRSDLDAARAAWIKAAVSDEERGACAKSGFLLPETDEGVADFHALRHTFGSNLARAGTPVKVAMDLMRHGDVNLTMKLYSHTVVADRARALTALPDLSEPIRERARATGTDNARAIAPDADSVLAVCLAQNGRRDALPVDSGGRQARAKRCPENPENLGEKCEFAGKNDTCARSSAGQSGGFLNRCESTSNGKSTHDLERTAESALAECLALLRSVRPDLACILERWDGLPEPVRADLLALVKSAAGTDAEKGGQP